MSDTSINRSFRFTPGTLLRVAQRLSGALNDTTLGPPIVDYLSAASVADFTAQIALVAKLADDQSGAIGSVSTLTSSQQKARRVLLRESRSARRKARFIFAGQGTVLHSEFQVGPSASQSLAAVLDRGRKTLAATRKYAADLSARGWPSSKTDHLEAALDSLTGIDGTHEVTKDGKEGLTAQFAAAANLLYEQCIAVQDAAGIIYPNDDSPAQPQTVEARARFLLGEFPPKKGATPVVVPTVPTVPTVPAPAATPHASAAAGLEVRQLAS